MKIYLSFIVLQILTTMKKVLIKDKPYAKSGPEGEFCKDDFWVQSDFLKRVFNDDTYLSWRILFAFTGINSKGNLVKKYIDCHRYEELGRAFDEFYKMRDQTVVELSIYQSDIDMCVSQNDIYEDLGFDSLMDVIKSPQAPKKKFLKRVFEKVISHKKTVSIISGAIVGLLVLVL